MKGNHGTFSEEVKEHFEYAVKNNFKNIPVSKKVTIEKGRGGIEKREHFQTDDIEWFVEKHLWKNLSSIGMVRHTVTSKGRETVEVSCFISSLKLRKMEKSIYFRRR